MVNVLEPAAFIPGDAQPPAQALERADKIVPVSFWGCYAIEYG